MNPRQAIKGITVLTLVGFALGGAQAETNAPSGEVHAIEVTAPAEAKTQAPESDASAVPVKADSQAALPQAEHDSPAAAEAPAAKSGILDRAMSGAVSLFERAKAFVMPSDK